MLARLIRLINNDILLFSHAPCNTAQQCVRIFLITYCFSHNDLFPATRWLSTHAAQWSKSRQWYLTIVFHSFNPISFKSVRKLPPWWLEGGNILFYYVLITCVAQNPPVRNTHAYTCIHVKFLFCWFLLLLPMITQSVSHIFLQFSTLTLYMTTYCTFSSFKLIK